MISIVCPVHNCLEYTKRCLKSLSAAICNSRYEKEIDIILIDDGSTDGTSEWVRRNYPEIKILKGDGNLWWSGAMNMGAKYALKQGTEYILVINNDNEFEENYIEKLISFTKEKKYRIVGSRVLETGTNKVWSLGGYFNKRTGKYGTYKRPKERKSACYSVDWLPGMGTLIHKSVFEQIGFWDEKDFPQYYGDTDFMVRARENGIDVYVYQECRIWNDAGNTGMHHHGSLANLIKSLYSNKSHNNIVVTVKFLKRHCTSYMGIIRSLLSKYGRYIGGFFKHKIIDMYKM